MTIPEFDNLLQSCNLMPLITDKLGKLPIDFSEKMSLIRKSEATNEPLSAAGVLLLLRIGGQSSPNNHEPTFILTKRSFKVSQPGDLSCPGGILNKRIDPILKTLLLCRLNPIIAGKARNYLQERDDETVKTIALLFGTAIRETWEETNLSPLKISFLGPLPTYAAFRFQRTIFPIVGFVKKEWQFHPNNEVERMFEIPLKTFFHEDNYRLLRLKTPAEFKIEVSHPSEFTCLIYRDNQDHEDILWGATFNIIMNFMRVVFDLKIPEPDSKRIVYKSLYQNYMQHR